ncbi:NmrA family transcriptional regulator [Actinoplanes sp. SE50]|uniref:NAD(P)H-binding protein n=1 Tax=unclassified Actinoplanes TaxID=2626549 RepID=UPI00023ECF3E|nr:MULTISPECIES: NAD(P)H-binding protein [unclassified Actinoplanes]AEV87221.1 Prestalk A differentiation protein A [Actinoplanes sp. SE50/110]ATO85622.1 NmrA family transcriptional regulator [Actinoplanes sp. SE50]SLM03035.1 NmrA family transcriptional regulator [Actinoplanes sp. SE50/110]
MIVVTGATGNVGRPLVATLTEGGARVRAVSRAAPRWPADLADPPSLRPALAGAEAFFLLVSGAGAHLDGPTILDEVKAAGVRRVVLLSSQGAAARPAHAPLRALEETVRGSGLEWTVLRPGGFASNALAWAESIRARREARAPFGDVGLPLVDPRDIAGVAAAALTDPAHAGRVYELTGPELSTPRQRAARIGQALGEAVRFVEQTVDEARAQMLGFMPAPVVDGTLAILGAPTAAEQRITPDVERVLGRPAGTFGGWADRNRHAFQ